MRGYFGIGAEGISKQMNVGNLFRTAHAFDASFVFTLGANYSRRVGGRSDTSDSLGHMPFYEFPDLDTMTLPKGCRIVGIELLEDSIALPSFHHPAQAVYILGPERGELSPALLEKCDHVLKIPTKFCVNVGIAGAIVMYDRVLSMGRFTPRPMRPGGPESPHTRARHGGPKFRAGAEKFLAQPPLNYND